MRFHSSATVEPQLPDCRVVGRLRGSWKLVWITRGYTQLTITGLSHDHLLTIPPYARTNILWDLGHVIYSLEHVLYETAGIESALPEFYKTCFRPGVVPADLDFMPEPDIVLEEFDVQLSRVQADLKADRFKSFKPFDIAKGVRLRTVEDALAFAAAHEGFHAGVISNLRYLVT